MLKASAASAARVSGVTSPCSRSSPTIRPYCDGSEAAATPAELRAAAPSRAAPPTSIISIASSMPMSFTPMAGANGLTFTITRSIGAMPWPSSSAIWAGTSRRARIPA